MAGSPEHDDIAEGGELPGEPVKHYMLGDQIKDRLLTSIMEGELAPGARIVETQLAGELGISQGPVREALRDLATLGLVELQPYRGARVRQPTREEHLEAMRVRTEIESMAAREAAGRLTGEDAQKLRRLNEEMARSAAQGDAHEHALKNTEFHATVVRASGNRTLERVWLMLQPFAQTYLTTTMTGLAAAGHYIDLHSPILEALLAGDPDGADEAMRFHGRETVALVEEAEAGDVDSPDEDSR